VGDPRDTYTCPVCDADNIGATLAGKLRFHKTNGERCDGSGRAVTQLPPEGPECNDTPQEPVSSATCSRTSDTGDPPPETPLHTTDTRTTETTADNSPDEPNGEPTPARTVETLPGVDNYAENLGDLAAQQLDAYRAKVNERVSPFDQPLPPPPVEQPPLFDQPSQAGRAPKVWAETQPMTPLGQEIAHRLKEMFHAYSNRMERNQQPTMGPSEIGTPCDRRIALSLMRYPTVNPGGDNWASFVGTCMHAGLEEMFMWADAGSGRYAPEVKLTFPSKHVPTGTTDLVDRVLLCVVDHKGMGQWSLDKLKSQGPSRTYRVQAHTYAYGATMRGERVKHVAIVGWPRDKGSLDDLYVWTEEYDPDLARAALKRVDTIADRVLVEGGEHIAYELPMDNTDCRFCPFYMKGAARSEGGVCNGRG
jgi:hypothetical protein